MKVYDIIKYINTFANEDTAYKWDKTGLQVGDINGEINSILLCLDVSLDVVNKAVEKGADMIISHHPFLFSPLENIDLKTNKGKIISLLIKNDICLYSAHTNMDLSNVGLNEYMAKSLGLKNIKPLQKIDENLYKITTYVPGQYARKVKDAICKKNAGSIGNYSNCTFESEGIGEFMGNEESNGFIGDKNSLTTVNEVKIEAVFKKEDMSGIINALFASHPYEEVAYEIIKLNNKYTKVSLGRVGSFEENIPINEAISKIKKAYNCEKIKITNNYKNIDFVKKVALCTGSGADLIQDISRSKAQLYITSDVKYHQYQEYVEKEIILVDISHFDSEICFVDVLQNLIKEKYPNLTIFHGEEKNIVEII